MGLIAEVSTAPDDAAAAAVLTTGPAAAGLPTVDSFGIEPYVQLETRRRSSPAAPTSRS